MNSNSSWFTDDDVLVHELRRTRRPSSPAPQIAGYDHLRELRRGGQGVVFVGTQISTRRQVAIKIVLDGVLASREARRRFEREIDLVATLRHPNIVRVYDSGKIDDGRLYYIMEYIEGVGLDEWIEPKSPDGDGKHPGPAVSPRAGNGKQAAVLEMFAKICDAVQYAHQKGVIHRDLKPSNVRIDPAGEPHVLDFGLAKAAGDTSETTLVSRSGNFMGSLPWASPEQAEGAHRQVDVRSDVYSLGVMLYQLLTREFPYRLDGPLRESLQNIQSAPPRHPREVHRDIDDEVATITLKCLSKEPDRRYQSAGELARDIRRYLAGEPIEAKRDSAWYSVRKKIDRYKTAVRAISFLLAASILFSIAMFWLRGRAVHAEGLAEERNAALKAQVAKNKTVREFLDTTLRAVDPWKHPGRDLGPLRELLDSAVKRLDGAFPNQPEVEAAIAGTLGADYHELGLHDEAEKLLRRSYELSRKTLGETDPETRSVMNNLGLLLTDMGRYEESAGFFTRLRDIQEKSLGPEHPDTLITINNLALDLDWEGRATEAEALYRQALEAQTRLLGEHDVHRLHTLNNLAACLPALGRLDESEKLYHELIEARTAVFGPEHPETLQAQMNLADLLFQRGRLAEAEDLLRELVATLERTLTPKHPLTLSALHNLAGVVGSRGKTDEAVVLARRAYEAQSEFAGPNDPATLMRKNELTCNLISARQWDEALPLATSLREEWETMFGAADWHTLLAENNLAYALKQLGHVDEAEKAWRHIIATSDPAEEATRPNVVTAEANLGALLADQGRWVEAESELRAAIAGQEQLGQRDDWRTAFIQVGLGRVLTETDRLDEAKPLLEAAYPALREALGDEHEKTQKAVECLVRLYEARGDLASAASYRTKLRSMK